jgi:HTH-type transcriptional regulator/antitoxin HigA
MSKREEILLAKEILSPPGDTILETIEELSMSQQELADRMGRHKKTINEIVKGLAPITAETAIQFERVLGIPASFWMERERQYQEDLERLRQEEMLENNIEWAKKFPIAEMKKRGLIPNFPKGEELVDSLLSFFGIASPDQWDLFYAHSESSFRISLAHISMPEAISVWLRHGELEQNKIDLPEFNKTKFKKSLPLILEIIYQHPLNFKEQLQEICRLSGVGVVYTPCLPKAPINGAVRWFRNNPLIQLSGRYKTNDIFWFSFFHEVGHILLHGKKEVFLEEVAGNDYDELKEHQANDYASKWLIPSHIAAKLTMFFTFDEDTIIQFSRKNKIHPGIIVGRLQHDGLIHQSELNHLKAKIELF